MTKVENPTAQRPSPREKTKHKSRNRILGLTGLTIVALFASLPTKQVSAMTCGGTWNTTAIADGSLADASPVMGNFNYLYNCLTLFPGTWNSTNVGIGTTSPVTLIDAETSTSNATVALYRGDNSYGSSSQFVIEGKTNPNYGLLIGYNTSSNYASVQSWYGGTGGGPLALNASGGTVGIGTTSPQQNLSVYNSMNLDQAGTNSGSLDLSFGSSSGEGVGSKRTSGGNQYGLDLYTAFGARLSITNGGNVGIGTTSPGYLLTVNGTAYASGAAGALSDIRHKDEVESLPSGALKLVEKLRPVSFVWKEPKDDGMKGRQMGFIAQEVEKILPSVVLTEHNAEKTKGLKYNEIIALLTKAMQEQQAEIQKQEDEIRCLEAVNETYREANAASTAKLEKLNAAYVTELRTLQQRISSLQRNSSIQTAQAAP